MPLETVAWLLMTGLVTGAAWAGIVLTLRQRRLSDQQQRLEEDVMRRQDQLEEVSRRVLELEARLDLSERLLTRQRQSTPPTDT